MWQLDAPVIAMVQLKCGTVMCGCMHVQVIGGFVRKVGVLVGMCMYVQILEDEDMLVHAGDALRISVVDTDGALSERKICSFWLKCSRVQIRINSLPLA